MQQRVFSQNHSCAAVSHSSLIPSHETVGYRIKWKHWQPTTARLAIYQKCDTFKHSNWIDNTWLSVGYCSRIESNYSMLMFVLLFMFTSVSRALNGKPEVVNVCGRWRWALSGTTLKANELIFSTAYIYRNQYYNSNTWHQQNRCRRKNMYNGNGYTPMTLYV